MQAELTIHLSQVRFADPIGLPSMWNSILNVWYTAIDWFWFYVDFAIMLWNEMTPLQYSILLISIAVGGFLLMGKGMKRL